MPEKLNQLRGRCSESISRLILEFAGDLVRAPYLLEILDDYIPGLTDVWILHEGEDPIGLREGAGPPELAVDLSKPNGISPEQAGSFLERAADATEPAKGFTGPKNSFLEPATGLPARHRTLPAGDSEYVRFEIPARAAAALVLRRPRPLSPVEKRYGEEISAMVGTVLQLKQTFAQRARVLREDFDLLVEATREIFRCQSMDDLYEVIARESQRLLKQKKHNMFSLQQYSPFNEELTCVALSGEGTAELKGLKLTTSVEKTRTMFYPRYEDGRIGTHLPRQAVLSFTGALLKGAADFQLISDVALLEADDPYYSLSPLTRSEIAVPIVLRDGRRWGVLNAENPHPNAFSEFFDLPMLQGYARIIAVFIQDLERRTKAHSLDDLVGLPEDLKKVIRLFAQSEESVLITGETGTGKELVARALHYAGARKKFKFIPVNSGAIEPNLMMSELFGHAGRSFTGAGSKDQAGLFQAADKGTIFLDEIENMPLPVQEAVLRVVDRGEVRKVGDTAVEVVDVRVIAATNVDLVSLIREGAFRQDLYYRLKILEIDIPPLRDRAEYIPVLFESFVGQLRRPMQEVRIRPELLEMLKRYHWPGNVRELKNLVKRMLVFSQDLGPELLPDEIKEALESGSSPAPANVSGPEKHSGSRGEVLELQLRFEPGDVDVREQVERVLLQEALNLFGGDRYRVAKFLGVSPPSVYRKIKLFQIDEERSFF